jgi:hypothetical protein
MTIDPPVLVVSRFLRNWMEAGARDLEVAVAVHAKIHKLEAGDERDAGRRRLLLHADVNVMDRGTVRALVHNLSTTGFLIEIEAELVVGSEVTLELTDDIVRSAKVVWSSGTFYGCTFDQPISTADLKSVLAASPVIWPQFATSNTGPDSRKGQDPGLAEPAPGVGTVTVGAGASLHSGDSLTAPEFPKADGEEPLSAGRRLQVIFILAVAAWCLIGLSAWLLLG